MFEKFFGSRLSTGNTEHGQCQHGSLALFLKGGDGCSKTLRDSDFH
jgi:hypothetical protein